VKAFHLVRRSNAWSRCKKQSLICNSLSGKDRTTLTPNLKHYLFCYVCHFALKRSTLRGCVYLLHVCCFCSWKCCFLLHVCCFCSWKCRFYFLLQRVIVCLHVVWHWRIVVRFSIGFYVNWIRAPYINISTHISPSQFFLAALVWGGTLHECVSQQPLWLNPKSAFITNFHDINEYF